MTEYSFDGLIYILKTATVYKTKSNNLQNIVTMFYLN